LVEEEEKRAENLKKFKKYFLRKKVKSLGIRKKILHGLCVCSSFCVSGSSNTNKYLKVRLLKSESAIILLLLNRNQRRGLFHPTQSNPIQSNPIPCSGPGNALL